MTENQSKSMAIEYSLLLLLAILWGSSYLFIKVSVSEIPPITLIAIRVTIAALLLYFAMKIRNENLPRDRKTWSKLFVQAVFNSIAAWTVLAWGQQFVDSGLASVLNSTSPIFVFFLTFFVTKHECINLTKLFAAVLGLIGVILIVGPDVLDGIGNQVLGQFAIIFGAFLYGCGAIYGKTFSNLPSIVTATSTMLIASCCLIPMSFIFEDPLAMNVSLKVVGSTIFLSVFCTAIAMLIYFRLLKTLSSIGVASQSYLRAGIGVFLGIMFLGETINTIVAIGIGLTVLGVVFLNVPSIKNPFKKGWHKTQFETNEFEKK